MTISIPPNPYDNLPEAGSTTEKYMDAGEWAKLTNDYLRRREVVTEILAHKREEWLLKREEWLSQQKATKKV